ncbi:DUF397 domain-containing protein [Amycolatopsis cihanbeyliensis]|uniref:Uncharacterized protein DUF397 n=1 Tax=Amycolatopsis cihanbeyliensis TaxID=1128664 RepID=A0A542DP99_AMYCI|nr:DUF397 domain-containing protein [Amycolatopsis cihanbeyliensis]TQJ04920.1 uncharacterized protein DUF397 [Amycolatopsis cihanbeyliensis]
MTSPRVPRTWRKSSRSANTNSCVEVAVGSVVGVRDTKDRQAGALYLPPAGWRAFTDTIRREH